jgi:hypothetical protein
MHVNMLHGTCTCCDLCMLWACGGKLTKALVYVRAVRLRACGGARGTIRAVR